MKLFVKLHIIIILFLGINLSAQESKDSVQLQFDQREITPLQFDEKLSDKYSGNDFNYEQNLESGENLITRFLSWFFNLLEDTFGFKTPKWLGEVLEYVVYGLLTLFAIWIIYKLITNQSPKSLFKSKTQNLGTISLEDELIEDIDFKKLLKKALSQKDYRLAVRYVYLDSLKQLSQKGMLKWHADKTNMEYLLELKDDTIKGQFKQLSYVYDNVWYGEFLVNSSDYNLIETKYQQLLQKLK